MLLGLSLILVGIGFKISLVPFHLWTPDVYQGAPAPVTAFLSSGSKVALFAALLRFAMYADNELWSYFVPVVWILAVLTMAVGNITALEQPRVKRLLAYSSIAHMGYLLMALAAIKQNSAPAIMFYLTVFAVMDLGAFGVVGTLSSKKSDLDELDDFRAVGYTRPWRSALLATCLFSLAGLPPTAGFIGKFVVFQAVLQANFVVLAIIGIVTVIISIYFYIKVIVSLYMRPGPEKVVARSAVLSERLACAAVLSLLLLLGLVPSPLFGLIAHALSFPGTP
jgi:NADH-quinone oxidoreductase subunit N